jgi:hypothetical protein
MSGWYERQKENFILWSRGYRQHLLAGIGTPAIDEGYPFI